MKFPSLCLCLVLLLLFLPSTSSAAVAPDTVAFQNGAITLHGEMKIYPAFGQSAPAGHSFTWRGSSTWADDVFAFLDKHCRPYQTGHDD